MIHLAYRAVQWGMPIAILIGAGSLSTAAILAMLATAWLAKHRADRLQATLLAQENMRAYIRNGGLHNPLRRMHLSRTK